MSDFCNAYVIPLLIPCDVHCRVGCTAVLNSTLLYFSLLHFTPLYPTLLYSTLLYPTLLFSTPLIAFFYSTLFSLILTHHVNRIILLLHLILESMAHSVNRKSFIFSFLPTEKNGIRSKYEAFTFTERALIYLR